MATNPMNAEPFVNAFLKLDPQNPLSIEESAYFSNFGDASFDVPLLQKQIKPLMAHLIGKIFSQVTWALSQNISNTVFYFIQGWRIPTKDPGKGLTQSSLPKIWGLFDKILSENLGISVRPNCDKARPISLQLSWNAADNKKLRDLFSLDPVIHPNDIAEQLNAQRTNGKNTDISFEIGGQLFHAHRAVLAKYPNLLSFLEASKNAIILQKANPEVFDALLEYVYTDKASLKDKSLEFVMEQATVAHNLHLPDLVKTCHLHLIFALTKENAQKVMSHAQLLEDTGLVRACHSLGAKKLPFNEMIFADLFFDKGGKISIDDAWERIFITDVYGLDEVRRPLFITIARFSDALLKQVIKQLSTGKPGKGVEGPCPAVRLNEKIDFSLYHRDASGRMCFPAHPPSKYAHLPDNYFEELFSQTLGFKLFKERPYIYYASWAPDQEKRLRSLLDVPSPKNSGTTAEWMNEQRKKGEGTDITFEVEGKKFPAHTSILLHSPYFKALLENKFVEHHQETITLHEVSAEYFEMLLSHLYLGEISLRGMSASSLMNLAQLADKLGAIELRDICHFRLLFMVSKETLLEMALYGLEIYDQELVHATSLFLQNNPDVLNTLDVSSLHPESLHGVVAMAKYFLQTNNDSLFRICADFLGKNPNVLSSFNVSLLHPADLSDYLELARRLGNKELEQKIDAAIERGQELVVPPAKRIKN